MTPLVLRCFAPTGSPFGALPFVDATVCRILSPEFESKSPGPYGLSHRRLPRDVGATLIRQRDDGGFGIVCSPSLAGTQRDDAESDRHRRDPPAKRAVVLVPDAASGVADEAARAALKQVFSKLGGSRQSALAALVLR